MDQDGVELSRRKLLTGIATAGIAALGAGVGTTAYVIDAESVTGVFRAGHLDLSVEWRWVAWSDGFAGETGPDSDAAAGTRDRPAGGTVGGREDLRLEFRDVYPGAWALLRLTVRVDGTPAYVRSVGTIVADPENGVVGPERVAGDAEGVDLGDGVGDGAGELDNELLVTVGATRSDGHVDDVEFEGSLREWTSRLSDGQVYRGPAGHADCGAPTRIGPSGGEPVDATDVTQFVRMALPPSIGNQVQTDGVAFDLGWEARQVPVDAADVDGVDPFAEAGPTDRAVD